MVDWAEGGIRMPRDIATPDYIRNFAQENRRKRTLSERLLWARLRKRRLSGVWFKQQEPMGRYIADFCAPKEKLIVEIDGAAHDDTKAYDDLRDDWFHSLGYRTLRVSAKDVENNIAQVIAEIRKAIQAD